MTHSAISPDQSTLVRRNIGHDPEIYAAIRYLEPGLTNADQLDAEDQDKDNVMVICVCLYTLLLGCLVFLWFYWR